MLNPRYTLSKMALFTAMKTEHRQAGKKAQSISRLFTGFNANEITARCQTSLSLRKRVPIDAILYGNSHAVAKEEDNTSFPSLPYSFLVQDDSTWLVNVWASVS